MLAQTPAGFRHAVGPISRLVPGQGMVTALVGEHLRLRLGTPDHLALKLAVVRRVMRRVRAPSGQVLAYIDVSAPITSGLRDALDINLNLRVRLQS